MTKEPEMSWCRCGKDKVFHQLEDHPFSRVRVACEKCHRHEATVAFVPTGAALDIAHERYVRWCECCVLRAQVKYLRDAARRLPRVERELAAVRCR